MSGSGLPARPALMSHADNSAKEASFMARLYSLRVCLPAAPSGSCLCAPRCAGRSIHRQATRLDRYSPFLDFALDEFLQVLRRSALGFDHGCPDVLQAL